MLKRKWLLRVALATCGAAFFLVYPLAIIWPSGWDWHHGAPYESEYFVMIVGIYATLGVFLLRASRDPRSNLSLIWFTIWSSLVHAGIMGIQSLNGAGQKGHLMGDVPVLVLMAAILAVLVLSLRKA